MKTKTISVTAYPYASQTGTIKVPEELQGVQIDNYILKHWEDIEFNGPDLDYAGIDFDWEAD